KAVGRQPAGRERSERGRGSWDAHDAITRRNCAPHQLEAGVGQERRAGIADEGDRSACRDLLQYTRKLPILVVLVERSQVAVDPVLHQELAAVAGILAVDG